MLSLHPLLVGTARPGAAGRDASRPVAWEWGVLLCCGAAAAVLSAVLDFGLKVPGHAILRAIAPIGIGMALVPRRGAGSAMAVSALLTAGLLHFGFGRLGPGAATSAAVVGVSLDLALRFANSGRAVWVAFAVAGVAANLVAFGVRLAGKLGGGPGRTPLDAWLPTAAVSYPLCGILAGLLVAGALFRLRGRPAGAT